MGAVNWPECFACLRVDGISFSRHVHLFLQLFPFLHFDIPVSGVSPSLCIQPLNGKIKQSLRVSFPVCMGNGKSKSEVSRFGAFATE